MLKSIKINLQQLKELRACKTSINRFRNYYGNKSDYWWNKR